MWCVQDKHILIHVHVPLTLCMCSPYYHLRLEDQEQAMVELKFDIQREQSVRWGVKYRWRQGVMYEHLSSIVMCVTQ